MRFIFTVNTLFLLLLLVTSCIHEEVCDELSEKENIKILPLWDASVKPPSRVFVQCYPQWGEIAVLNFIASSGGKVYLQPGEYDLLLYTNTSSRIGFRNMESFDTAEAFVDRNTQPDELFCGSVADVEVQKGSVDRQITVPMIAMVYSYPFTYSGVTGLQYVSRVLVSVDGISQAVKIASRTLSSVTYTTDCNYVLTNDGFYGTLRCFGHGTDDVRHTFTVRFEYGGQTLTKNYDVTEMLNVQGRIDIRDELSFDPVEEGGLHTDVGDWEDNTVDIPIN